MNENIKMICDTIINNFHVTMNQSREMKMTITNTTYIKWFSLSAPTINKAPHTAWKSRDSQTQLARLQLVETAEITDWKLEVPRVHCSFLDQIYLLSIHLSNTWFKYKEIDTTLERPGSALFRICFTFNDINPIGNNFITRCGVKRYVCVGF